MKQQPKEKLFPLCSYQCMSHSIRIIRWKQQNRCNKCQQDKKGERDIVLKVFLCRLWSCYQYSWKIRPYYISIKAEPLSGQKVIIKLFVLQTFCYYISDIVSKFPGWLRNHLEVAFMVTVLWDIHIPGQFFFDVT